jgi:hypothetical protein
MLYPRTGVNVAGKQRAQTTQAASTLSPRSGKRNADVRVQSRRAQATEVIEPANVAVDPPPRRPPRRGLGRAPPSLPAKHSPRGRQHIGSPAPKKTEKTKCTGSTKCVEP